MLLTTKEVAKQQNVLDEMNGYYKRFDHIWSVEEYFPERNRYLKLKEQYGHRVVIEDRIRISKMYNATEKVILMTLKNLLKIR